MEKLPLNQLITTWASTSSVARCVSCGPHFSLSSNVSLILILTFTYPVFVSFLPQPFSYVSRILAGGRPSHRCGSLPVCVAGHRNKMHQPPARRARRLSYGVGNKMHRRCLPHFVVGDAVQGVRAAAKGCQPPELERSITARSMAVGAWYLAWFATYVMLQGGLQHGPCCKEVVMAHCNMTHVANLSVTWLMLSTRLCKSSSATWIML